MILITLLNRMKVSSIAFKFDFQNNLFDKMIFFDSNMLFCESVLFLTLSLIWKKIAIV